MKFLYKTGDVDVYKVRDSYDCYKGNKFLCKVTFTTMKTKDELRSGIKKEISYWKNKVA